MMAECQGRQIILGGDGRCDSPGYCAKYGSYSCMDLDKNIILDTQLVQVIASGLYTHMPPPLKHTHATH